MDFLQKFCIKAFERQNQYILTPKINRNIKFDPKYVMIKKYMPLL
jgi:hypothetical protein